MGHTTFHAGAVHFGGRQVERLPVYERVRLGIGYVPQGRDIFPSLSVEENLIVAARLKEARQRAGGARDEPVVRADGLEVDLAARVVRVGGRRCI
jgi:ABC-type branched-subunit amino acid transport system ATPase component